jgi:hypothetical protein
MSESRERGGGEESTSRRGRGPPPKPQDERPLSRAQHVLVRAVPVLFSKIKRNQQLGSSVQSMNDLEDHIFKQNVPGRYSSWVEEDHHAGDESRGTTKDGKDDATDNYERNQQIENNSKLHHQHQNSSSYCYTRVGGVKGVLADYKLYHHYERQKQETNQNYSTDDCAKKSECRVESTREQQEKSYCDSHQNDENSSQTSSQDEDEDDEFIQKYRMKQMERWKAAQLQHRTCVYGELVEVDPIQFSEIVDKEEHSNVTVFILLYENCIPECITLLRYMESIARSMVSLNHI